MAFKSTGSIEKLLQEDTTEEDSENVAVSKELLSFGKEIWKKSGLMVIILLTILTAFSVNAFVQSLFQGLSPENDKNGILLRIISQLLYVLIISVFLIVTVLLVTRKEIRERRKRKAQVLAAQ